MHGNDWNSENFSCQWAWQQILCSRICPIPCEEDPCASVRNQDRRCASAVRVRDSDLRLSIFVVCVPLAQESYAPKRQPRVCVPQLTGRPTLTLLRRGEGTLELAKLALVRSLSWGS